MSLARLPLASVVCISTGSPLEGPDCSPLKMLWVKQGVYSFTLAGRGGRITIQAPRLALPQTEGGADSRQAFIGLEKTRRAALRLFFRTLCDFMTLFQLRAGTRSEASGSHSYSEPQIGGGRGEGGRIVFNKPWKPMRRGLSLRENIQVPRGTLRGLGTRMSFIPQNWALKIQ